MIHLKTTNEFGRGLYASQFIPEGTIILECEILILNEQDTNTVNTTELKYYTFKYDEKRDCLVLGHGEIFNHDDLPNVSYRLVDFNGRKVMQFKAISSIEQNSQLFIDYNDDIKVNINSYINQKSLM